MGAQEQAADPNARRYEILREESRHFTQAIVRHVAWRNSIFPGQKMPLPPEAATLNVEGIDAMALVASANWRLNWRKIVGQNRPYFRRFEVALWHEGQLYGLAVGRASRGPDNVTIHYIERAPNHNPFAGHVAWIVTDAADRYAKLIGRQRVKLRNPVDALLLKYRILGFSVDKTIRNATYWARQV